MTLRFAPARQPARSPIARTLARRAPGRVANDEGTMAEPAFRDEAMLHEALRHFAVHGLGAARVAASEAERAIGEGNRERYRYWLGICRALDRRLAGQLARRHAPLLGDPLPAQPSSAR